MVKIHEILIQLMHHAQWDVTHQDYALCN